jgi:hypothetical protein
MVLLSACGSGKNGLSDGLYRMEGRRVGARQHADSLELIDVESGALRSLPLMASGSPAPLTLVQHSFDVDVITTLVKYRPASGNALPQMETQLSAALYLGRRADVYRVDWPDSPFPLRQRRTLHYGLSTGAFLGVGGAPMNPWVTNYRITDEYTGVVLSGGVAMIGALNRTTLGAAVGWDALLNHQASLWVYQGRPWLGLVFGVNLN